MLIVTIETASSVTTMSAIARVATSLLMLMLSLGVLAHVRGYYGFCRRAGALEEDARRQLERDVVTEADALKAIAEYHVARAASPIIPTWMWRLHRKELNRLWSSLRLAHVHAR